MREKQSDRRRQAEEEKRADTDANVYAPDCAPCSCRGEKRRRILDAAARAFAEEEFHKVRTEDIASAAGVAKGTVFLHFASKEELFVATMVHGVEVMSAELDEALRGVADPMDQLKTVCERLIAFQRRNECMVRLLHGEKALAEHPRHQELHSRNSLLRDKIAGILRDGQAAGRFRDLDAAMAGRLLFGMLRTAMRVEELRTLPPEQAAALILDLFLNGICAQAAPSIKNTE